MIARRIRGLLRKLEWHVSFEEGEFEGIPVLIHVDAPENYLLKISSALKLIKDLDQRTYALIGRFLASGVAVTEQTPMQAWYDGERRACCLGSDFVEAGEIDDIALSIVHELCHARLVERGIGYGEEIRLRVEKICLRRELAFAQILMKNPPSTRNYIDEVEWQIENLPYNYYEDKEFKRRARVHELMRLRSLKALQAPKILRRCAVLHIRRRRQR